MFIGLVTLTILAATALGIYLMRSGWGIALLLWPLGVKPLFPKRMTLKEVFGVDPKTCDYAEFEKRSEELRFHAESSALAKVNRKNLEEHHARAMRVFRYRTYLKIADRTANRSPRQSWSVPALYVGQGKRLQMVPDTTACDAIARTTQEIQLSTSLVTVAMDLML